ncbi:flagellar biosynthetic protein FliR [Hippea maritima]|uniref:Type III secretion system inner membrane R protein n=1 Tax=Hippea maritima (strain ATCC 700847 / DSM 10411 / MH2) TaxID=760142 RepID=F2LVQ9_HIPMA|nr:flagellar biosynthetic protein FliR [Hippea maritima]AEA33843.1 type III secretion system inner membrane R protein [Hippea maritima DSM 10411]
MSDLLVYSGHFYTNFLAFLFILLRVSSIIVFAPIFSSASIPPQVKVAFSFVFAVILYPTVRSYIHIESINTLYIVSITLRELMFAVLLSLTIHFIWSGLELGAQLVGFNMGFSIANVISPEENIQISVLAEFESIFAILVFLIINGHYVFIQAMTYSFEVLKVGGFSLNQNIFHIFNKLTAVLFDVSFTVLAPVIIALFITQVVFGVIARTMPQMNIMIVAFPLSIAIGFITLGASFVFVAESLIHYYHQAFGYIYAIIRGG